MRGDVGGRGDEHLDSSNIDVSTNIMIIDHRCGDEHHDVSNSEILVVVEDRMFVAISPHVQPRCCSAKERLITSRPDVGGSSDRFVAHSAPAESESWGARYLISSIRELALLVASIESRTVPRERRSRSLIAVSVSRMMSQVFDRSTVDAIIHRFNITIRLP